MTRDPIARAAEDIHREYAVDVEVIHKHWPADGIVYAHMSVDENSRLDEWLLLDQDCTYEKAFAMMERAVMRELFGKEGGGVIGVR